jgi:WD40 repeat protein
MNPRFTTTKLSSRRIFVLTLAFVLLMIPFSAFQTSATTSSPKPITLKSANPTEYGDFGYSVAISTQFTVVGAWQETSVKGAQGVAGNVYVYNTANGARNRTLDSPNAQLEGWFGKSVAISGNILLVGAPDESVGTNSSAGNAYLFNLTTGKLIRTFKNPDPQTVSFFGTSVAISGNIMVIGAPDETVGGQRNAGQAFVFNEKSGRLIKTLQSPTPEENWYFGSAVASNGKVVIVGAPELDCYGEGNAYVFGATNGTLLRTLDSPNSYYGCGEFGSSIAMNGDLAIIGAPTESLYIYEQGFAYVFNAYNGSVLASLDSNNLTYSYGQFGRSVAISNQYVIVGGAGQTIGNIGYAGEVFVYSARTYNLTLDLTSPNKVYEGLFGWSIGLSGKSLIVGAYGENESSTQEAGNAYLYKSI